MSPTHLQRLLMCSVYWAGFVVISSENQTGIFLARISNPFYFRGTIRKSSPSLQIVTTIPFSSHCHTKETWEPNCMAIAGIKKKKRQNNLSGIHAFSNSFTRKSCGGLHFHLSEWITGIHVKQRHREKHQVLDKNAHLCSCCQIIKKEQKIFLKDKVFAIIYASNFFFITPLKIENVASL